MPRGKEAGSEIEVREASADDVEAVYSLARELAATLGDSSPRFEDVRARLFEFLEEPRARVLVAEGVDSTVVGVASLWIKPDLAHGDTVVEVPMLVVTEGSRGEGVGKVLMEVVRRLAAGNEANLIELVATTHNVAAREFYRTLGFVETDHITLEFVGDMEAPPDPEED
jgi:ribosomal protein S18 acetylase RimI-like enzyme